MADIHDYLDASRATDEAISNVQAHAGAIEDSRRVSDPALATLLAGVAIARAIQEASTRIDYVLRDIERRGR